MDAEMSEMRGGTAPGVKRVNDGADFLGKKKYKEDIATSPNSPLIRDLRAASPNSAAIPDFVVHIQQPNFVKKDGQEVRCIQHGCEIAEVFELLVKSGEKKCSKIHGTVQIDCEHGIQTIFRRPHDNPQDVDCEESLELTGQTRAMSGGHRIYARLDLMEGNQHLMHDSFLIYSGIKHAQDYVFSSFKDCPSNSSVKWKLRYVVYKEAVVGTIEIKFKPATPVGVRGTIYASTNMFPEWETLLFSKKKEAEEYHSIERLEGGDYVLLPLLKSVAAVPLSSVSVQDCFASNSFDERPTDGRLLIDVDLENIHDGGVIAQGVLEFPVENFGDYTGTISSKYGEMQVKVSFVRLPDHLYQMDRNPRYSWFK